MNEDEIGDDTGHHQKVGRGERYQGGEEVLNRHTRAQAGQQLEQCS